MLMKTNARTFAEHRSKKLDYAELGKFINLLNQLP